MPCPEIGLHRSVTKWKDIQKNHRQNFKIRYSEEFKSFICEEFLTGALKRRTIEDKYNIGYGSLTTWLKEKGYDYSKLSIVTLPNMGNQSKKLSNNKEASLGQLKTELQEARLLAETYRKRIEVAEKEYKIK